MKAVRLELKVLGCNITPYAKRAEPLGSSNKLWVVTHYSIDVKKFGFWFGVFWLWVFTLIINRVRKPKSP